MNVSSMIAIHSQRDVILHFLSNDQLRLPKKEKGEAFAPTNIALCKYWGKRNVELNLPMTSSLSIALPHHGVKTTLTVSSQPYDVVILNDTLLSPDSLFVMRLVHYLDLFRTSNTWFLNINIEMNVPVAAGFASSAAGFASLILALNDLFDWQLPKQALSIFARLGSGSAARSLWTGFVEWHRGQWDHGMDSYGEPLKAVWPQLCIGLVTISDQEKSILSRVAMQRTMETSCFYPIWPRKVLQDLAKLKEAIYSKDFSALGQTAENNALAMHAMMLTSTPPICYWLPETIDAIHRIWEVRKSGLEVYFTEDAGPNLKLLFLDENINKICKIFDTLNIITVFN